MLPPFTNNDVVEILFNKLSIFSFKIYDLVSQLQSFSLCHLFMLLYMILCWKLKYIGEQFVCEIILLIELTNNYPFQFLCQKVLNEAGYVPSNSEKYPLGGIVSAIENAFHATPQLVCSKGDLEELRICFYKDFKVRLCCLCFSWCTFQS